VVKEIRWAKGKVEITDEKLQCFTAKAAVITVPTGVWLAEENAVGRINYLPAIPEKQAAVTRLGFGSAIKVLLYFRQKFWLEEAIVRKAKADLLTLHMALSEEEIPTWWTQSPKQTPLLTGWLSGPKTAKLQNTSNEEIISKAIASISSIFALPVSIIQEQLLWSKVFNWSADPFTRGSYSYSTTQTAEARKIMLQPVEQTLFFAGEALYDGPEMGTVEAALISGRDAAEKILLV
jgi:monoamine oxidase